MAEDESKIALKEAHLAETEGGTAQDAMAQSQHYANRAIDMAGLARDDAEKAFNQIQATQQEDKTSIQKAGFALSEAEKAMEFGELARQKAEAARNHAENARNTAEDARSVAEKARDYSESEWLTSDIAKRELQEAKDKAELALQEAQLAHQKVEEALIEAQHSQEHAKQAEERYKLVIEGTNDGLWDWNIETNDIYWNGRFFLMLGIHHPSSQPTSLLLDLVHPDDRTRLKEAIETALTHSEPTEDTFRIKNAQGTYIHCCMRGRTILNHEGKPIRMAGMITDITERKELEVRIKQSELDAQAARQEAEVLKESAELANQRKTQALVHLAHEIRTPLNAIMGYSEMLKQGLAGELTDKQDKYAQSIHMGGQHLLSLINDILDIAKIEAGKIQLSPQWVFLELFMENEVKPLVKELAVQKKVHLTFDLQTDIDGIEVDPQRLRQILLNLINNAIKYNRENGTVIVKLYKTDDKQWLVCEVRDTGMGIPKERIPQLFQEFYQVEEIRSRKQEEGTGLGLCLSKRLIEAQGGDILVDSEEGVGSIFTVRMPVTAHYKNSKRI